MRGFMPKMWHPFQSWKYMVKVRILGESDMSTTSWGYYVKHVAKGNTRPRGDRVYKGRGVR